jgi:uncharacterized protein
MPRYGVTVIETHPHDQYKYCIIGVPDVGLVGSIALGYAIQKQDMDERGYIDSPDFPPVIVIHEGQPQTAMRLYHHNDIAAIISEIPIEPHLIAETAQALIEWVKTKHIEMLVAVSGIAVPNRLEIDEPDVYGVGSSESMTQLLQDRNIPILREGYIAGLHAILMKASQREGIPCIILLAQSHLQYPDPGAAVSLLHALDTLLHFTVDTDDLAAQEEEVRVKMRALMQRTHQQMQQVQKDREQEFPALFA